MTTKTTFFKEQFPTEDVVGISPACFSEAKKKFVDHDLNIGWVLTVTNSYCSYKNKKNMKKNEHRYDRRIIKKCQGAMECRFEEIAIKFRYFLRKKNVKKQ